MFAHMLMIIFNMLNLSGFTEQIEEQVVSVILDLASADSLDEYRTEAVAVSIRIYTFCSLVGKELSVVKMQCWEANLCLYCNLNWFRYDTAAECDR